MHDCLFRKGLVLAIIILFIGMSIIPSTAHIINNSSPLILLSNGKTIYVDDDNTEGPWDGTQEHPYQYIQDGIDNASKGDMVFVYNGIYIEHPWLRVHKSINLIGEDKYNTIIDNQGRSDGVHLRDGVNISGFTIKNSDIEEGCSGILFNGDYINISDNIISNNYFGIASHYYTSDVTIFKNEIINNVVGIDTYLSKNDKVIGNTIKNNSWVGLGLQYESNHFISLNNFVNNRIAVFSSACEDCSFTKNNFIRNTRNVKSDTCTHTWDRNYWDRPMILPKPIIGWKVGGWLIPPDEYGFPGIRWYYPWPMFDWRPALKPYDI